MTTIASNRMLGKWRGMSRQHVNATSPHAFKCMAPSTTSPNKHSRWCVTTVTK
jgi:hypothetical protein